MSSRRVLRELFHRLRSTHKDVRNLILRKLPIHYVTLFCRIERPAGSNDPIFWRETLAAEGYLLGPDYNTWVTENLGDRTLTRFYYEIFEDSSSDLEYPYDKEDLIEEQMKKYYRLNRRDLPKLFQTPELDAATKRLQSEMKKAWETWQKIDDVRKDFLFQKEIAAIRDNLFSIQTSLPFRIPENTTNYNQILNIMTSSPLTLNFIDPLLVVGLDMEYNNIPNNVRAMLNRFFRLKDLLKTGDLLQSYEGPRLYVVKTQTEIKLARTYIWTNKKGKKSTFYPPGLFDFFVQKELFTAELARTNYNVPGCKCCGPVGYSRQIDGKVEVFFFLKKNLPVRRIKVGNKYVQFSNRKSGLEPAEEVEVDDREISSRMLLDLIINGAISDDEDEESVDLEEFSKEPEVAYLEPNFDPVYNHYNHSR